MTDTSPAVDLRAIAFAEPEFDGQFLRALDAVLSGGADIGECFVTARRIAETMAVRDRPDEGRRGRLASRATPTAARDERVSAAGISIVTPGPPSRCCGWMGRAR